MKLKAMNPGERGRICGYGATDRPYRQKLLQMGLIRGAEFTLVRMAPLGDPIEISVRGSSVTLRKAEADALEVEKV
jgi:ferrous iron transport protein A